MHNDVQICFARGIKTITEDLKTSIDGCHRCPSPPRRFTHYQQARFRCTSNETADLQTCDGGGRKSRSFVTEQAHSSLNLCPAQGSQSPGFGWQPSPFSDVSGGATLRKRLASSFLPVSARFGTAVPLTSRLSPVSGKRQQIRYHGKTIHSCQSTGRRGWPNSWFRGDLVMMGYYNRRANGGDDPPLPGRGNGFTLEYKRNIDPGGYIGITDGRRI